MIEIINGDYIQLSDFINRASRYNNRGHVLQWRHRSDIHYHDNKFGRD